MDSTVFSAMNRLFSFVARVGSPQTPEGL